ncbi:GlsB/YeaQ/YmgE family stress response membrane protein [Devosia sp.]|uniref:GlsB/YeaQ/YmgE family stress response membrane protein n=1 Tax=Devosia sp. TaxID=1871048 RepID=UPI00387EE088
MSKLERQDDSGGDVVRDETIRHVVVFLVIGAIAGWLASWIVGGEGLLTYLISGVIGSFVGGYLFSVLKIRLPIANIWLSQIITSTVGAIIVVIIARLIAGH